MKKLFALLATAGVLLISVAPVGAPVAAAKGSKKLNLFLHWDDPAGDCAGPTTLTTVDSEDTGDGCGFLFQMTGASEVLGSSGQGYLERLWGATDGVPFVLDATKPIKGLFAVNGYAHPVQAGNAILDIKITGMVGNRSETLAEVSQPYTVTPAGGNVVEISVKPPKKLDGKKFKSLSLLTVMHGMAVGQHYIDLETNPAHITIPVK